MKELALALIVQAVGVGLLFIVVGRLDARITRLEEMVKKESNGECG